MLVSVDSGDDNYMPNHIQVMGGPWVVDEDTHLLPFIHIHSLSFTFIHSKLPNQIQVMGGIDKEHLQLLANTKIESTYTGDVCILEDAATFYPCLEIRIKGVCVCA